MVLGAIALLLLAFALVAAELFVPSHGVLAVLAFLVAVGSVILAYSVAPALGIAFMVVLLIATPIVFYWAVRVYPLTAVGQKVLLRNPPPAATEGFRSETEKLEQLLGRQGIAMTLLRPAGNVEIDGRCIDAVSESEMIEAGNAVEVIKISGMKVIVKALPLPRK